MELFISLCERSKVVHYAWSKLVGTNLSVHKAYWPTIVTQIILIIINIIDIIIVIRIIIIITIIIIKSTFSLLFPIVVHCLKRILIFKGKLYILQQGIDECKYENIETKRCSIDNQIQPNCERRKKYSIQFEHNIVQILLAGFQEEILGQENMFA